jgi:hypothetical protein
MPMSYFFTQETNAKWIASVAAVALVVAGSFVPFWTVPFYRKTSKELKKVDEEFGPTRYGAGKKFFI